MMDYGVLDGEEVILVCGSKEKAEEMVSRYPGCEVHPVEQINKKWVKSKPE